MCCLRRAKPASDPLGKTKGTLEGSGASCYLSAVNDLLGSSWLRAAWLLVVAACAARQPAYNYLEEPDPRKQEYVLGPSDVVRVTVWHNPDLSGDSAVRPDGTITIPLIGDLKAAGRTPHEVRDEISEKLKEFVKDEAAIVTVAVAAINSYRFTMACNFEPPGNYTANAYVTVSEAIALAGGPNRLASPEQIVIVRTGRKDGAPKRIPIDYPAILAGKKPEQDLPVLAGDTVYVP